MPGASPRTCLLAALAVLAVVAVPAFATSETREYFFEETAEANWSVPHQCADGAVVDARLLVRSTRDFESPETEDDNPTARAQYLAVCPDGFSFSWVGTGSVNLVSTDNLKSVAVDGTIRVRDNSGVFHQVSMDVDWTGEGPVETSTNPNQGFIVGTTIRKQRAATATGTVTFDGDLVASGNANHRITPFIRTDEDIYTQTGP
jgi:hypothetical protein